ncbi:MAG: polyprenol monophosphomannose synthase [Acidobacteria bacterium]|nr:polyprenol monophosphomannose synthase [Acidobacteriota bacterium]
MADEAVASNGQHNAAPTLSLVVPTRNESLGIEHLLERLETAIDIDCEIIFVDDSDDPTPWSVRRLAESQRWSHLDIRLIHRTSRQRRGGLGSAVVEGVRQARGEWVCVLDSDLQHPPELIPEMLNTALDNGVDVVIGSRYANQGRDEGLTMARRFVSRSCAVAAKTVFPLRLRKVSDPLSGFFLVRREAIDPDKLHPHGFKILLEILGRNPQLSIAEIGFTFSERYAGLSKASVREGLRYFWQLGDLRISAHGSGRQSGRLYLYNIHNILSVQSDTSLPELEKFRVRMLEGPPSIRVNLKRFDRRERGELIDLVHATPRIRYDEALGHRGFSVEVEIGEPTTRVWASATITKSPHVLYTNVVEPILRWHFVECGYALVHAACFTDGEDAHLVTARTDTGKTTTMLKILERGDYGFLSDDLTLVNENGEVLTYPKPLTISQHTVHALQSAELTRSERLTLPLQSRLHSKQGREFALYLAEKNIPVATINAIVQRLVPPPKYHVERLVPGAPLSHSARVRSLSIIERGDDFQRALKPQEALDILLENCEDAYGFPPYSVLETLLHSSQDDDLRFREREIIASALDSAPATLYGSTTMSWATDIHIATDEGATDIVADLARVTPG